MFVICIGYIKVQGPWPSAHKVNTKFEILLVKIFSLKQKDKSNNSSYSLKNQMLSFQENSLWFFSFKQGIAMGNLKQISFSKI